MNKILYGLFLLGSCPLFAHANEFSGSPLDFIVLCWGLLVIAFFVFLIWGIVLFFQKEKQEGKTKMKYSLISFVAMIIITILVGDFGDTSNSSNGNVKVIYQVGNDSSTQIQLNKDGTALIKTPMEEIQTSWEDIAGEYISFENERFGVIKGDYYYSTSNDANAKRGGAKLTEIQ